MPKPEMTIERARAMVRQIEQAATCAADLAALKSYGQLKRMVDGERAVGDRLTWDQGDDEPTGVTFVLDYTAPTASEFDEDSAQWGRATGGEWKGYKNGGKIYLDWPELTRRWGPLSAPEASR